MTSFLQKSLLVISCRSPSSGLLEITHTLSLNQTVFLCTDKIKEDRISKYMLLKTSSREIEHDKPLVLLFDWLFAKPAALAKYCNLYHNKGMDVLVVSGRLRHFLWPPTGMQLANRTLDYLMKERSGKETFLVHAFSIGAYVYTLMMISAHDEQRFQQFRSRVVGQIFDSIVIGSYDNMSTGISSSFTGNKAAKDMTLFLMNVYFNLTRKHTRDRYDEFVKHFIHCPIHVSTLIFYARNDPMSDPAAMKTMINTWRNNFPKFDVQTKSWEKSIHAAHLKVHEQEYLRTWDKFIQKVV